MKLQLHHKHLSLEPFEVDGLEDLVVITGKNGSGKTQLLNLISDSAKSLSYQGIISIYPSVNRIISEGLVKNKNNQYNKSELLNNLNNYFDMYKRVSEESLLFLTYLIDQDIEWNDFINKGRELISVDETYLNFLNNFKYENSIPDVVQKIMLDRVSYSVDKSLYTLLREVRKFTGKELTKINEVDFTVNPTPFSISDPNMFLSSNIELIFFNYARNREINNYSWYKKDKFNSKNNSVPNTEYEELYPAPWNVLNEILAQHNINIRFKIINEHEFSVDLPLRVQLFKNDTGEEISFENLSSGENVLIGLVIKLFIGESYKDNFEYPQLIILDEPDAHLHPQMSKLLISILKDTFVDKFGIKVILTTHSPSTVALAPEESIYLLENGNPTSLNKVTKDIAIKSLIEGVPTLSVNVENRRTVIVESQYDTEYYQKIYLHLRNKLNSELSLSFIESGEFRKDKNGVPVSNCSQVIESVSLLRKHGNKLVYGIVDWDCKNIEQDGILVLGKNSRYNIESVIFDPLLVSILLIHEKLHLKEIGIVENIGITSISSFDRNKFQNLVNSYLNNFDSIISDYSSKVQVEYCGGLFLEIPKEYLMCQGHKLEEKIIEKFSKLNEIKRDKENKLKIKIIDFVMADFPDLIPVDFYNVFKSLEN